MVQLEFTSRWRKWVFAGPVLVLMIWPLVQHAMVLGFGTNPWKLMGFSMYCVPYQIRIEVWSDDDRVPRRIEPWHLPASVIAERDSYASQVHAWGRLASPDRLGGIVLRERPEMTQGRILVFTRTMAPGRNVVEERTLVHRFRRTARPVRLPPAS